MSVKSSSIFSRLANQFRNSGSLFFSSHLTVEAIHQECRLLGHAFRERIYTPATTLWMFIGQVLSHDHSCRDAVSRLNVHRIANGQKPCDTDTSAYCEARQRLPEQLVLDLARTSGQDCQSQARLSWLWMDRVVKLVDGFTVTMPDTEENQREYPQSRSQKAGVGFPIIRAVMIFSLAVGAVLEVATAKYAGKKTGESTLLRKLLNTLLPGEILLADRYYATYWLLAAAWERGFDVVVKSHHLRKVDFRKGLKLGGLDQIIGYPKPETRPYWMTSQEYVDAPEFILVRHLRYQVIQKGFRTRQVVIATTLLDSQIYTAENIALLYRQRWQVEIDIRSLKTHMQMERLRCKSPSMVRKEIYCHMLAYNLIRRAIAEAASIFSKRPCQLSFTGAMQAMNAFLNAVAARGRNLESQYQNMLLAISQHKVGDRPDRIEPRLVKLRPKPYKLLNEPRSIARKRAA
jgi:putative transposase